MKDMIVVDKAMTINEILDAAETLMVQIELLSHAKELCYCTACKKNVIAMTQRTEGVQRFIDNVKNIQEEYESIRKDT